MANDRPWQACELRALHEGPLGDWIVYLSGGENRPWAGRQLYAVLTELFDLPHGLKEAWVHALVERLAGHQPPLGIRYACPCCDFLTLEKPPVGTFALCPVCWWEDDNVQFDDLDYRGGANTLSLREARENFKRCGASSPRFREHMRQPLPEETP